MFGFTAWEWLVLIEHELLLFAAIFFLIGAFDELAMDIAWLWLVLTRRTKTIRLGADSPPGQALAGKTAIFVPAWYEADVIGTTIAHMLAAWPQAEVRIYVGCYRNDPATHEAAIQGAGGDPRVRVVVLEHDGPTTKADCLNRLYTVLAEDEAREGSAFRMVVLQDAEDMVHPLALPLFDRALLIGADFVQLPVLPEPQLDSRWIGSHYCEEFAEAHGKAMVVRDALGVGLPSAGVGCAVARPMLARLAGQQPSGQPFAPDSLTEDYEFGLRLHAIGARCRFLRARAPNGSLVATRAYFPAQLDQAVRQKTRWVHGIAFQGWDRLGWSLRSADLWMRLRDRRGPFTALLLAVAYSLLVLAALRWVASLLGFGHMPALSPVLYALLAANLASFLWRSANRFAFTAHEYGWAEGMRAVLRIPVANIIAIMAGRRALFAYIRTLAGAKLVWDKTVHDAHPARVRNRAV